MAGNKYNFKYLPLEGKLTGKSFEYQTERAINDLGDKTLNVENQFGDITDIAQRAYDAAKDAQNTADTAQTAANNAQTAAENAQTTADAALTAANSTGAEANDALLAAQKAQQSADEAKSAANNAQSDATEALEKAQEIDSVKITADIALEEVNNISSQFAQIEGNYEAVGTVDLNKYYTEFNRLYVDADSPNAPTDTEKFFVDVNVDTGMEAVRQFATGAASGTIYIRNGVLTSTEPEPEPLTPTDGTLVINGDLNADLTVNGNVEVSGTISGTVEATGTISFNELTGDVTEGAELYECDVQVDGGSLTFSGSISDRDGAPCTESAIDIANGVTAIIYRDLTASTGEDAALTNEGTLTVEATIDITSSNDEPVTNAGTIDGSGTIYVNDEVYYDGGILAPTNGTLVVEDDLSTDLTVNGNVEVTGEISGSVTATGTITYGSLADEAEINENAEIYECDFSVDEGSLTFSASLTDDDGLLTTAGTVTNSATTVIYLDLTAEVESGEAFVNSGALTVESDINANSGSDEPVSNTGTIDGSGTLYANGGIIYDGGAEYTVEWGDWGGGGDSTPAGTMAMYAGSSTPDGWLLCNGSTVSREDYADLFAAIGTTWGSGDGSTTFALPDMRNRFPEGAGSSYSVGAGVSAGLPQITGYVTKSSYFLFWLNQSNTTLTATTSGCFSTSTRSISHHRPDSESTTFTGEYRFTLNASSSSSIYSTSVSTVQPAARAVYYIIKT